MGGAGDDLISLGIAHSGNVSVVFGDGTGAAGSLDRVKTLGIDRISGFTFTNDTLCFNSLDFGISGVALIGSDKGNGTDGNIYLVTVAPVTKAVDLNGAKNNGAGAAIVVVGGSSDSDIYFTLDRNTFSTANSVQIAILLGITSSFKITADDFLFI